MLSRPLVRVAPFWRLVATSHSLIAVVAARGQRLAVRAERHRVDLPDGRGWPAGRRWPPPTAACRMSLPVASIVPSGLKATESIGPPVVRPADSDLPVWRPEATSHSCVPLPLPVASIVPSGLNATESIGPPVVRPAAAISGLAAKGHVPQLHAFVPVGGQYLAVRAEPCPRDLAGELSTRGAELEERRRSHVPQPDPAVRAAGGQRLAVRAERH